MKYYSEKLQTLYDTEQELLDAEYRATTIDTKKSEELTAKLRSMEPGGKYYKDFQVACNDIRVNAKLAAEELIKNAQNSAEILMEDAERDIADLQAKYDKEYKDLQENCKKSHITTNKCMTNADIQPTNIPSFQDSVLKFIYSLLT